MATHSSLSALKLVAHSGSNACHLLSIPVLVKLSSVGEVFRSDDSKEILRPGSIISNESMLKSLDAKQSQMVASPSDRPPTSSATLSAKGIELGQKSQALVSRNSHLTPG